MRSGRHIVLTALACLAFATQAGAKSQFIDKSRIIYPTAIGELELVRTHYDEHDVASGVGLTYELASKPGVQIDVFVYPAGRMPEADAMQAGMADMRASVEQAQQAGYYGDVHLKGERKLDLQASEHTTLHGRMMSFDFTRDAVRYESRALLFHRFDYYLKVRTSTDAFESAALDQAVMQVAADVIPEIRVRNIGDCKLEQTFEDRVDQAQANNPNERQRKSNSVFMTDRVPPDQLMKMLEEERIRQYESGCVDNFGDKSAKVRKGEQSTTIEFPKGAWGQSPP